MFRMQTVNDDDEHTRALLRLKQEFMRRGLSDASTASFVYTCIDALGNELPISLPHQVLKKRFLNICAILLFTIFTFYHLGFAVVSHQKPKSLTFLISDLESKIQIIVGAQLVTLSFSPNH